MTISVRYMPGDIRLLLTAKYIDDGATVTKLNGQKKYTLRRNIKIYGENSQEIKCDENCVFLVDDTGNIDMISNDKELVVHVHPEDLMYDIQEAYEENK